ncbi:peptidylprolyl isomerase fpr3 [Sorochytrium milnesiophthora]
MFYGLQVVPGKKYEQVVEIPFQVSMVTLAHNATANQRTTLYVTVDEGNAFPIATLVGGKLDQQMVDVAFSEEEQIAFHIEGPNAVHLIGSYIVDEGMGGDDDDDEDEEMDPEELAALKRALGGGDDDDDDDEDDDDEEMDGMDDDDDEVDSEEEEEEEQQQGKAKAEQNNKRKQSPAQEQPSKKQKNAKGDANAKEETKADKKQKQQPEQKQKQAASPQTKKLSGGITAIDTHPGDQNSKSAKRGSKVSVRYIGKLTNGKIFDQNAKGAPFTFTLGAGEVIKGWDIGVEGMKVGGRRKLVIPAPMAYGKRGAPPDIPANATLEFEVKLLAVN